MRGNDLCLHSTCCKVRPGPYGGKRLPSSLYRGAADADRAADPTLRLLRDLWIQPRQLKATDGLGLACVRSDSAQCGWSAGPGIRLRRRKAFRCGAQILSINSSGCSTILWISAPTCPRPGKRSTLQIQATVSIWTLVQAILSAARTQLVQCSAGLQR